MISRLRVKETLRVWTSIESERAIVHGTRVKSSSTPQSPSATSPTPSRAR